MDGGTNADNPTTYTVDDAITLADPTKEGFTFKGWMLNGKAVTQIQKGSTGDITLTATWEEIPEQSSVGLIVGGGIAVVAVIAVVVILIIKKKRTK